jgi:hypothetical protein
VDQGDEAPSAIAGRIVRRIPGTKAHAATDRCLRGEGDQDATPAATYGTAPPAADAAERLPSCSDRESERPVLRATILRPLQRPLTREAQSPALLFRQLRSSALRQQRGRVKADTVLYENGRRPIGPAPGFAPTSPKQVRFARPHRSNTPRHAATM